MATAFVLTMTNFEYDDDVYYTIGSTPTKIYRNRESAKREQLIKCKDAFSKYHMYSNGFGDLDLDLVVDGWWTIFQGSDNLAKTADLLEEEPDLFLEDGSVGKFFKDMKMEQFKVFLFQCWKGELPFTIEEVELEE